MAAAVVAGGLATGPLPSSAQQNAGGLAVGPLHCSAEHRLWAVERRWCDADITPVGCLAEAGVTCRMETGRSVSAERLSRLKWLLGVVQDHKVQQRERVRSLRLEAVAAVPKNAYLHWDP